jgi:hypothetical protein
MTKYTPQGLYEEFRQFSHTLDDKEKIYPKWEDMGREGEKAFTQTSEYMNRLIQEVTMFEHHICVLSQERQALATFIERVPTYWKADFFELWEFNGFIFQFFRTSEPVNPFLIGPICQGLPVVEHEINKNVEED